MKYISKKHMGNGYKELISIHKKNGSYISDVKNNNKVTPKIKTYSNVLLDLLEEQGYICAYCLRKIDSKNATIEHIISQSYVDEQGNKIGKKEDTNYDNMLAVCKGDWSKNLHCDRSRSKFQKKRPLLFISPLNEPQMKNIKFSQSGRIYYKVLEEDINKENENNQDKEIREDINKVLNLNCENLIEQRGRVLKGIKSTLSRYRFDKNKAKNLLDTWECNNGRYKEFCQVAIYELKKHI